MLIAVESKNVRLCNEKQKFAGNNSLYESTDQALV